MGSSLSAGGTGDEGDLALESAQHPFSLPMGGDLTMPTNFDVLTI
jgi:hypothetical protein